MRKTGHTSNHCKKEPNILFINKYNTHKQTIEEKTGTSVLNSTQEENKIEETTNTDPKNIQSNSVENIDTKTDEHFKLIQDFFSENEELTTNVCHNNSLIIKIITYVISVRSSLVAITSRVLKIK